MSDESLIAAVKDLFPESHLELRKMSRNETHSLRLVPPGHRAKLAVPAWSASAAAKTIHRPSAGDTALRAALRRSLAVAEQLHILRLVTPTGLSIDDVGGSIVEHLAQVFDQPIHVGLMVGSARANQKPVLNVFSESGTELGFAKVGLGALADQLVAAEARALRELATMGLKEIQVPHVISVTPWRNHSVLVMSSLRPDRPQRHLPLPASALRELGSAQRTHSGPIHTSQWLERIVIASHMESESSLTELSAAFHDWVGETEWEFVPWHGDFGPWNMARTSEAPMVWDWERFEWDMPRGLDGLHFLVHRDLAGPGGQNMAHARLLDAAAKSIKVYSQVPAERISRARETLVAMYLLTYAARFISEGLSNNVPRTTALGRLYASHLRRLLVTRDH